MFKNLIVKYLGGFIVEALRIKAKETDNKLDDKLIDAVEKALEGKDYDDIVESVEKEIDRAKAKVKSVKKTLKGKGHDALIEAAEKEIDRAETKVKAMKKAMKGATSKTK